MNHSSTSSRNFPNFVHFTVIYRLPPTVDLVPSHCVELLTTPERQTTTNDDQKRALRRCDGMKGSEVSNACGTVRSHRRKSSSSNGSSSDHFFVRRRAVELGRYSQPKRKFSLPFFHFPARTSIAVSRLERVSALVRDKGRREKGRSSVDCEK